MKVNPHQICFACMRKLTHDDGECAGCGWDNRHRANPAPQLPFSQIGGRYIIGKTLGQGGFGITYVGYDMETDRRVAIKEFFPSVGASRSTSSSEVVVSSFEHKSTFMTGVSKFIQEAETLSELHSVPNVVHVYDAFLANNTAYIVMEFVEGGTLSQYLRSERGGRITMAQTMKLFTPLFDTLEQLHARSVIHRDIKPSNLMIRRENGELVLLDFGAARSYLENSSDGLTSYRSTGYTPKEQYTRNNNQDGRSDQYALCATIYRAITGKVPPNCMDRESGAEVLDPPSRYCSDITHQQEKALLRGMSLRIEDRFPSVAALKAQLVEGAQSAPPPPPPPPQEKAECFICYLFDGKENVSRRQKTELKIGSVVDGLTFPEELDGCQLERTENYPLTVTPVSTNNIITVRYVKRAAGEQIRYCIRYFYDGKERENEREYGQAEAGRTISNYRMDKSGKLTVERTVNYPLTLKSGTSITENTIQVHFRTSEGTPAGSNPEKKGSILPIVLILLLIAGIGAVISFGRNADDSPAPLAPKYTSTKKKTTPTPRRTQATPAPAKVTGGSANIESNGIMTINWTYSGSSNPVSKVWASIQSSTVKYSISASASGSLAKLKSVLPGYTYLIELCDSGNRTLHKFTVNVPQKQFTDLKTLRFENFSVVDEDSKTVKTPYASSLKNSTKNWFFAEIYTPSLTSRARSYNMVLAVTSPEGQIWSARTDFNLDNNGQKTYWDWKAFKPSNFTSLPAGVYKASLYLDGGLVSTRSITLK